ncbi:MAG: methyl-accepting chemotaxis protein [Marinobacterium sp.]|nr:methyl-accepting chemotaxis protein [Marinobacterium sp.]
MKFSHKIVLAVSLILVLALSISAINQTTRVSTSMEAQIEGSSDEIVSGIAQTVDATLQGYISQATLVTNLVNQATSDDEVARLIRQPELARQFLLIGIGYENQGHAVISDPSWARPSDWDPRRRAWYALARQQNRTSITEPYEDAGTGEILISVAAPMQNQGQFYGASFFDVSLAGLSQMLNRVDLMDAGYAFMISANGNTISHPDSSFNGQNISHYIPSAQIREGVQTVTIKGTAYNLILKRTASMPWYVGVLLNKGQMMSVVDEMALSSLIITVVSVLIGVAALTLILKSLMRPIINLEHALHDIAAGDGDLTRQLDTNCEPEFAALAQHFNTFTARLRNLIQDVISASDQINQATHQSSDGARASSTDMGHQLDELEMLAAAMNEMAASATQVAGNARQAAQAVASAEKSVEEGGLSLQQTSESISHLSAHVDDAVDVVRTLESASDNIESILAVINDIADQTNLLALNAAIEAARAGEQGRGFAVVADEVRTLAHRTTESTTEIRQMIEQLQNGTRSAVETMTNSKEVVVNAVERSQQLAASFTDITTSMHQITAMNTQIASAAEQQSSVSEEINKNTVRIRDICATVSDRAQQTRQDIDTQLSHVESQKQALNHFTI